MKKFVNIALSVLLLLFLTACGGETLPEGVDEETLFHAGKDVMLLLVDEEYDAVHAMLREDQRVLFSAEDIAGVVSSALDGAGIYKQIEDHIAVGQVVEGERYAVAVLYCEFSDEDVLVRVSFDADMELVGFSLDQQ